MRQDNHSIRDALEPLFERANAEGLWFYHSSISYRTLWFTPQELRMRILEDRYVMSPENWTLRSPDEFLAEQGVSYAKAREAFAGCAQEVRRVGSEQTT